MAPGRIRPRLSPHSRVGASAIAERSRSPAAPGFWSSCLVLVAGEESRKVGAIRVALAAFAWGILGIDVIHLKGALPGSTQVLTSPLIGVQVAAARANSVRRSCVVWSSR